MISYYNVNVYTVTLPKVLASLAAADLGVIPRAVDSIPVARGGAHAESQVAFVGPSGLRPQIEAALRRAVPRIEGLAKRLTESVLVLPWVQVEDGLTLRIEDDLGVWEASSLGAGWVASWAKAGGVRYQGQDSYRQHQGAGALAAEQWIMRRRQAAAQLAASPLAPG